MQILMGIVAPLLGAGEGEQAVLILRYTPE